MSAQTLIALLKTPASVGLLTDDDWNELVVQGRKNQLLGQLGALLERSGDIAKVPPDVVRHLQLDMLTAKRRGESALWELNGLRRAMRTEVPLVVLKGCAYVATGDPNHHGRSFSDIDLMVERSQLRLAEGDLVSAGWKPDSVDAYDAAYYRNWMHEVPPMVHIRRNTVLDLHHAINPPIAQYHVSPDLLIAARQEVVPGLYVLAPLDRVIHCAIHLIQEGETKKLLRDLYDLHVLISRHCKGYSDVSELRVRSVELGVDNLVSAAVAAANQLFGTNGSLAPSSWLQRCLVHAARHAHEPGSAWGYASAQVLLAYSHWIKMPLRILIPHLIRKSAKGIFTREDRKSSNGGR